ncbi:hypothetical protein B0H67DRAFT_550891 [Lasiosphaeris hirsuta]|uniref:Uncharacterized protein n=1 Tax=Lasiosphaeris hirsuta TaxID=260670 RepID=A0AA40B0C4_9PEZI|nr:hypothetical protein B0H67DRAFT_550891 [Lasiosphaeris hirsuta]
MPTALLPNDPIFFRLRGHVLPPGSEAKKMLGRVVRNYAQPLGGGYTPEDGSQFTFGPPDETKWLRASDIFSRSASGSIDVRLLPGSGASAEFDHAQNHALTNSEVLALALRHQPEVYQRLLADPEAGAWIRANCGINRPLFMITGVLVWRDAVQQDVYEKRAAGQAQIDPVAVAMAATQTAAPLAPLVAGSTGITAAGEKVEERNRERESEDSHVFAVEYKVIRRRRRDFLGGFAPKFQDHGPAVDTDRQYANAVAAGLDAAGGQEEDFPELALDFPWLDAVEELDGVGDIDTKIVEAGEKCVEFAIFEDE